MIFPILLVFFFFFFMIQNSEKHKISKKYNIGKPAQESPGLKWGSLVLLTACPAEHDPAVTICMLSNACWKIWLRRPVSLNVNNSSLLYVFLSHLFVCLLGLSVNINCGGPLRPPGTYKAGLIIYLLTASLNKVNHIDALTHEPRQRV